MKKIIKIIVIIIIILSILGILFYTIDKEKISKQQTPIFCIKISTFLDGGTVEYLGLGYKIIIFHRLESIENYYDGIHIGSWFMTYDSALNNKNNDRTNIF